MKRINSFLSILCSVAVLCCLVNCTQDESNPSSQENEVTVKEELDDTVKNKYTVLGSSSGTQSLFGDVNCHDPKLFQDDDGTYYVYSTDASVGNVERTGLIVRSSTDLVTWKCEANSALQGYWDKDWLAWEGFVASTSDSIVHSNASYTAYTWAPTVIKQNGLYYMFHGTNNTCQTVGKVTTRPASSITFAIASTPKGPFYPASYISSYDADTQADKNETDIVAIQTALKTLGVTYSQSFLVRYTYNTAATSTNTPSLDGTALTLPDYSTCKNAAIYGAIDPEFVYDVASGNLMTYEIGGNTCYAMTYGSWSLGIVLVYVDAVSLKPVNYLTGAELDIPLDEQTEAGTNSARNYYGIKIGGGYGAGYEGSQVIYNSSTEYYYLFVSMGDLSYEYRVGVGRSKTLDGTEPYLDASGKSMFLQKSDSTATNYYSNYHAIGSKIVGAVAFANEYSWRCPGGQSILRTNDGKVMFACHTRTNFKAGYYFYLQCRQMFFTQEGWPVLNQNEYYDDYNGSDEKLAAVTAADIAGTYDTILTVRGIETSIPTIFGETVSKAYNTCDATPTASCSMAFAEDGSISGSYSGTWKLASDGYTITISLKDSTGAALGTFKGYVLKATDWARIGSVTRQTISFTTIDSTAGDAKAGEYFFGNKHNY